MRTSFEPIQWLSPGRAYIDFDRFTLFYVDSSGKIIDKKDIDTNCNLVLDHMTSKPDRVFTRVVLYGFINEEEEYRADKYSTIRDLISKIRDIDRDLLGTDVIKTIRGVKDGGFKFVLPTGCPARQKLSSSNTKPDENQGTAQVKSSVTVVVFDEIVSPEKEKTAVKGILARLVELLIHQEDISTMFHEITSAFRALQYTDNMSFFLEKMENCVSLAYRSQQYDDSTLSFLEHIRDVIEMHIELQRILEKIAHDTEKMRMARTIEQRRRLSQSITAEMERFNKNNVSLMEFEQELEKLQREGVSKDTILSLYRPNFSTEN